MNEDGNSRGFERLDVGNSSEAILFSAFNGNNLFAKLYKLQKWYSNSYMLLENYI